MDGELRRAFGRKEPSAGFADRVMQALPAGVPAAPQMAVRRRSRVLGRPCGRRFARHLDSSASGCGANSRPSGGRSE